MKTHEMPSHGRHTHWDRALPRVLVIDSGDVVSYHLPDATGGLIHPQSTADDLLGLKDDHALLGPLDIRGAEPGDTLEIEVLDLEPGPWGWTGSIPGYGLLKDRVSRPHSSYLGVGKSGSCSMPLAPFCGTMGVSPATKKPTAVMPPGNFGGNLDCRDLILGSRLWLPVQVPKAHFSVGNPHAVQGHGEVCGTALECPMNAVFRFTLRKGHALAAPLIETPNLLSHTDGRSTVTLGTSANLMEAVREALRRMLRLDGDGARYNAGRSLHPFFPGGGLNHYRSGQHSHLDGGCEVTPYHSQGEGLVT